MASAGSSKPAAPPVILPGGSGTGNNILINPSQRANPVLENIRNVGKEFSDIIVDYQVGRTTGVLFLSLKYHRLHPEYIHTRIEKLGGDYSLRILLILSDISEHRDPIRELTKTCLINNITVIVAFSFEEAGHYLSTFKQFEHKPPDLIKERVDKDHHSMLRTALTSINKVNKTDVETLRTSFGSFSGISQATAEQLQNLPGFGHVKVKNIKTAFDKPIRHSGTASLEEVLARSQDSRQGKGKDRIAVSDQIEDGSAQVPKQRPLASAPGTAGRSPSPEWEIEKESSMPPEPFDIELDLN